MRKQIRNQIRQLRRSLSLDEQLLAGEDLLKTIRSVQGLLSFKTYGIYLSSDGEIDTNPLISELWNLGANVYLPVVLNEDNGLEFRLYTKNTKLVPDRYGILEPDTNSPTIDPANLNVLFTPLVAFDKKGNRLGMGGGYYDRLLSNLKQLGRGPIPIGLAHNCQLVEELPCETWDIPLPAIVTPKQLYNFLG